MIMCSELIYHCVLAFKLETSASWTGTSLCNNNLTGNQYKGLLMSFLSIQIIFSKQVGDVLLKNCTNHLLKIYVIEVKHILLTSNKINYWKNIIATVMRIENKNHINLKLENDTWYIYCLFSDPSDITMTTDIP